MCRTVRLAWLRQGGGYKPTTVPCFPLCTHICLQLPGTGLKRWRDKPPALSPGELQAAL